MRPRLLPVFTGLAMAAFAVGAGSAKADVIFGNVNPTPACGPASGPGHVCGITETSPAALMLVTILSPTVFRERRLPGPEMPT